MEVHHHSHTADPGLHGGKKKWTHYFWEFFMLFLAVTLGFLVENQREHYVEHQREKQFIKSLVNEVEADTARLNEIIRNRDERERLFDSLSFLLDEGPPYDSTNRIYYYSIFIPRNTNIRFIPNDGTMQQLKNAGGLRLIRNRRVADSIIRYDVSIRALGQIAENEMSVIVDYRNIVHRFFNSRVLDQMMDTNNIPSPTMNNPPLLPFSKTDLNEFNYKLFGIKALNRGTRREIRRVLQQAENLLATLKKEYHLK
jgi:hypothetical protein